MYARMNATSAPKMMAVVPETTYDVFNATCTSPIYATANAVEGGEHKKQQQEMRVIPENAYEEIPGSRIESTYSSLSWGNARSPPQPPPLSFEHSNTSNAYDRLGGICAVLPASPVLKRKGVVRRKRLESGNMAKANRPLPAAPAAKSTVLSQRRLSFKHGGRSGPPASVINAAGAAAVAAVANAAQRMQRLPSNEEQIAMEDEVLDLCVAMFDYIPPVHQLPIV